MTSIYDEIKTARELVIFVKNHGLSTKTEDICKAQDIFGNSTVEELVDLANDLGRNNDNGEPDPKGTWSSGRMETRSTFYSILFHIWNWEDATRFLNQHSNPEYEELKVLRKEHKKLFEQVKQLTARRDELLDDAKRGADYISELSNRLSESETRAAAAEAEIVKLKARLFDLLIKD